MTRAREELYMTYASSRTLYGSTQHNPPSRFLSEIDAQFQPAESFGGGYDAIGGSYSSFGQSAQGYQDEPTMLGQQPVISDEPRYVPDLNEGDSVKHSLFGVGTIVEMDGDNATIYFKGKGAKKLNIAFAPLEKLG